MFLPVNNSSNPTSSSQSCQDLRKQAWDMRRQIRICREISRGFPVSQAVKAVYVETLDKAKTALSDLDITYHQAVATMFSLEGSVFLERKSLSIIERTYRQKVESFTGPQKTLEIVKAHVQQKEEAVTSVLKKSNASLQALSEDIQLNILTSLSDSPFNE